MVMPSLMFAGRYGIPNRSPHPQHEAPVHCDAAGVRRLTVHDARHACARLLVDLICIARDHANLRHADQAVTIEIYANASSAATREALRRLAEILH